MELEFTTLFRSIWPIDGILLIATTLGQGGPGNYGNEEVLRIPQSSSITGTSPSDCSVSYTRTLVGGVLPLCRDAVGVFYSPSRLGYIHSCRRLSENLKSRQIPRYGLRTEKNGTWGWRRYQLLLLLLKRSPKVLKKLEDSEIIGKIESILTTALLRSARLLRRVLEAWGERLSLGLQWRTTSWREKLVRSKTIIKHWHKAIHTS